MNVLWIIDNKYRDLYGVNSLKINLQKKNINLILINKYNWKYAIRLFDPHYVILPNIYENSGLPMLKFCVKNNIKSILYNVEGFHLDQYSLDIYFPKKHIKYLNKIFVWCPQEKIYLYKIGYPKDKIIITGSLRYQNSYQKKLPAKIKTIGIISSNKYFASRFDESTGSRILNHIFRWKDFNSDNAKFAINFMHYELDFLNIIKRIIFASGKKYNFILRPHPMEDINFYNNKNFKIDKSSNINFFLDKVDVVLNHYSSVTLDALKRNVPVISLENLLKNSYQIKALKNFFPIHLASKPKNINEVIKILKGNFFLKNYQRKEKNKLEKIFNKFHTTKNSVEIIIKNLNFFNKKKKFNFFGSLFFFIIYEIYFFIKYNRETAYRFYIPKDKKLLKIFSLDYDK